jgi:hypothetical protein
MTGNPAGYPVYLEGFRIQNSPNKGLNFVNGNNYRVVRNITFEHQYGGGNGMNAGFIDTEGNSLSNTEPVSEFCLFQNISMEHWIDGSAMKIYSHYKFLIEDVSANNGIVNGSIDPLGFLPSGAMEGLAIKGGHLNTPTVRFTQWTNIPSNAFNGNHNVLEHGEFYHNLVVNSPSYGVYVNNFGRNLHPIYFFRNTFLCPVVVRDGADETYAGLTDSTVGPFYFANNVIINDNGSNPVPYFTRDSTGEAGNRIITANNLTGNAAAGIANATTGALMGSYRTTYLGLRGYEYINTTVDLDPPSIPTGFFLF